MTKKALTADLWAEILEIERRYPNLNTYDVWSAFQRSLGHDAYDTNWDFMPKWFPAALQGKRDRTPNPRASRLDLRPGLRILTHPIKLDTREVGALAELNRRFQNGDIQVYAGVTRDKVAYTVQDKQLVTGVEFVLCIDRQTNKYLAAPTEWVLAVTTMTATAIDRGMIPEPPEDVAPPPKYQKSAFGRGSKNPGGKGISFKFQNDSDNYVEHIVDLIEKEAPYGTGAPATQYWWRQYVDEMYTLGHLDGEEQERMLAMEAPEWFAMALPQGTYGKPMNLPESMRVNSRRRVC